MVVKIINCISKDDFSSFFCYNLNGDKMIKIVFMGTPEFSVPVLDKLINNYDVIGVVTQPDKKVGRKGILTPPPVAELAKKNNIPVFQPAKIRNEYEDIIALKPDMIVTCAYGQIIPKILLDLPKYGCINVHASLLPKLRGGAPIHHAIIDGYDKTGITIMYMDEHMDSGDIIKQSEIDIKDEYTTSILHDLLSKMGANLLIETIPSIIDGTCKRIKQDDSEVTFGYNISKEDEVINFNKSSLEVFNQIRGLNGWPIGYTLLDGKRLKIYESRISNNNKSATAGTIIDVSDDAITVKTSDGAIDLTVIQVEGKSKMSVRDYLNGKSKEDLILKRLGD